MKEYKAPGVYIEEIGSFPASVVAVDTALPVFIGFTEKAEWAGKDLSDTPTLITSLREYEERFGFAFPHRFTISPAPPGTSADFQSGNQPYTLSCSRRFYLYHSLRLFFANGGGKCYIVSAGRYPGGEAPAPITAETLCPPALWTTLETVPDITLVVVPDAVACSSDEAYAIGRSMLAHCAALQNRFAILDVPFATAGEGPVAAFRTGIGTEHLGYGAAYWPLLHTAVVKPGETDYRAIEVGSLQPLITEPVAQALLAQISSSAADHPAVPHLQEALLSASPAYCTITEAILTALNLLPPAAAVAGVYCATDAARGVWKAPANVTLSTVIQPAIAINNAEGERLNVHDSGKSVNAIRSFTGKGTLVWGARTLDGNSQDWRYISVRRTAIMIEESLKHAMQAYVFEPNDAATWITLRAMAENFLTNIWKGGGLAGAKPDTAFYVRTGLGSTMTPTDILDGRLLMTVGVALLRPAEFIVLSFTQQMQPS